MVMAEDDKSQQVLQEACQRCPGCCCKMFFMRGTKKKFREVLKQKRELNPKDPDLYQLRFILKHFRRIKDTRDEDAKSWQITTPYAYTCDGFDEEAGICTLYEQRPQLCRAYHCSHEGNLKGGRPDPEGFRHLASWDKMAALAAPQEG